MVHGEKILKSEKSNLITTWHTLQYPFMSYIILRLKSTWKLTTSSSPHGKSGYTEPHITKRDSDVET